MKKILLILAIAILLSCSNEEIKKEELDCNCDRVVETNYFNITGNPISYLCIYTTINDCTQIQKEKQYTTNIESTLPKIGECR